MKPTFTFKKKKYLLLLVGIIVMFMSNSGVLAQNDGPISTVGTIVTTDVSAVVPVTVTNFVNVTGGTQKLLFDQAIIDNSTINVTLNPLITPFVFNFGVNDNALVIVYVSQATSIPDNSVIFYLHFNKLADGTSPITWDADFTDRTWISPSGPLNDNPIEDFYFPGSLTFQGDAPVTTIPDLFACPGSQIDVPVLVSSFNTIGSISLYCTFDPSVLQLQTSQFTNTSGFPGLSVSGSNTTGEIAAFATNFNAGGTTLPDNAVLFTLHFTYLGGSTNITWIDDGVTCEYAGPNPNYPILDDTPQSNYYIDGSVSPDVTPIWMGLVDSDWTKSGNWSCDVPISTSDVTIGVTSNDPVIATNVVVNSLTIDAGASLTLDPTATLEVTSTLTNNATAADLVLKSSAGSTATLLHNSSGVEATIERYIPPSPSNSDDPVYHFVSVPLTQASNPLSGLFLWSYLFEFDAVTQQWIALGAPTNTPLFVDQGYMIYKYPGPKDWQADTTYIFEGPINNGPFTFDNLTHPNVDNNHHLVSNPYPSAIDWDAASGWTKTNVNNAIWIWTNDGTTGKYASYVGPAGSTPGVGVNGGSRYIPLGQAFMISTNGAPTFAMDNDIRVHNTQAFYKGGDETAGLLRMKACANESSDEIVLRFVEGSTPSYDGIYDATKLFGNADAPQMYSVAADDKKLSINSLPFTTDVIAVPVGFQLGTQGLVSFEVSSVESFDPAVTIYLKDELTGDVIDLRQTQTYSFSHDTLNNPERFKVIFNGTTTIIESAVSQTFCYVSGDQLEIQLPGEVALPVRLQIFNVSGQLEAENELSGYSKAISVSGLKPGVYIVKAISKAKIFTQKVMVR